MRFHYFSLLSNCEMTLYFLTIIYVLYVESENSSRLPHIK